MKRLAGISALSMLLLLPGQAGSSELDGTEWEMRMNGIPGLVFFWKADILKFDESGFTSAECAPYGFAPSAYEAKGDTWSAVQTNAAGEQMEWQGVRDGDRMTGTFTWTRADGAKRLVRWRAKRLGAR